MINNFFQRFNSKATYLAALPFLILVFAVAFANGQVNSARPEATFTNSTPITIPNNSTATPYPSTINVSGLTGNIANTPGSVKVTLNGYSHNDSEQVSMVLVGPTGAAFLIFDGPTSADPVSNITFSISDSGQNNLPATTPLVSGVTYKPTAYFTGSSFPAPGPGTNYANPGPADGGTATFSSVYGGTSPNGNWSLFIRDFGGGGGSVSGGWTLEINTGGGTPAAFDNRLDYFGNGFSDWAILTGAQPDYLVWKIARNDNPTPAAPGAARINQIPFGSVSLDFNLNGIPAFGDYTGDGRADFTTWREGSQAYYLVHRSENATAQFIPWGATGDLPGAEGDYDGDGKMDPTVLRQEGAAIRWLILRSGTNTFNTFVFGSTSTARPFDIPLAGADYTGDGADDPAVARIMENGNIQWLVGNNRGDLIKSDTWGNYNTDFIIPAGDYDGDNKADFAVWRGFGSFPNNTGTWAIRKSSGGDLYREFGASGAGNDNPARDLPLRSGDYDGDKKTDIAVWRRSNETFYVLRSSDGALMSQVWGGGIPVANFGIF